MRNPLADRIPPDPPDEPDRHPIQLDIAEIGPLDADGVGYDTDGARVEVLLERWRPLLVVMTTDQGKESKAS